MKRKSTTSIVIPIYNEEDFLERQIKNLVEELNRTGFSKNYEIIIIENGSTDQTYAIAKRLIKRYKQLRLFKLGKSSYGAAIKLGLKKAQYSTIIQFDIDFIDIDFLRNSIELLHRHDIVIGSKLHPKSADRRPWLRLFITKLISIFIGLFFGYRDSDTHGIKAYNNSKSIIELLDKIKTRHHFFETELILRALVKGLKIKEIPVRVEEIRPSRFPTTTRVLVALQEAIALVKIRRDLIIK